MASTKLKLYNTTTQEKEAFNPIDNVKIGMYVCVTDARAAVAFDVLHRYLKHLGYEVNYVSNLTHLSDTVINQAEKCEKNPSDFSFEDSLSDITTLHCLLPTNHQPSVSEHMDNVIKMIEKIIEKDFGYVVEGDVFFSVTKSQNHGQLSGQQLDHTQATGNCLVVDHPKKRNPADFSLWKATKPGEPSWDSPWGPGRPGWHIGCSAMSTHYLSPRFDILGGGAYLKSPHHEHVIAQTRAAFEDSDSGVTYWLHNAHVTNNNVEMGNSLDNSVTIREVTAKYHPLALRHFLISSHYRAPLEYSVSQLERSSQALISVYQTLEDLREALIPLLAAMSEDGEKYNQDAKTMERIQKLKAHVDRQLSNDFNTANIFKEAFDDMMRFVNNVISQHKTWKKNRLMPMVVPLLEVEKAVKELLNVLGLLTTQSYADFLKQMKQMAVVRVKLGAQEIAQDKVALERCHGVVKKTFKHDNLVTVELMELITPSGNVVYYVRKSCVSKSEATKEYHVMSLLREAQGIVHCTGNAVHELSLARPTIHAFYVEYAEGGTLVDEMERHGKALPIASAGRFTRMVLQALRAVHDIGYIHGDLHPENVFLFPREGGLEARLSDFGVTKKLGDNSWWSKETRFLGCPSFMSPESVAEGSITEKHDVWAVGLLVTYMLSTCNKKKKKCLSYDDVTVRAQLITDQEARDFVDRCLQKDPGTRATVSELLHHSFCRQ